MNTTIKKRIEEINSGRVPEGYEKTSFGIFPCDWEKSCLGDLFNFSGGLGKSREELGDKGACYLHYGDMHVGDFNKVSYSQYLEKPKYNTKITGNETFLMKDGDIAFLDASEDLEGTSRAVLIDNPQNEPFIAGLHTILAKEKVVKLSKFYKQYITIPNSVKKQFQKLASGFKVYGINRDTIKKIEIVYPKSSQEQSRIAEILMQWDKAIELQEKYIKQLELRKKALMQRLLTPKEGWKKTSLKEVLIERVELASKKNEFVHVTLGKEGVVDKTAQYNRDFLVKNDDKLYKITRFNDMCYNPANLKFGVICVNKYGTAIFSPIYITFSVNEGFNVDFIGEILSSANFIEMIRKYEEGTVYERQAVKPSDFLKGIIFVPEKKVQDRIALLIAMINKDLDLQTQKLDNLIKQRKALQQYLLTGIVRV